MPARSARAGIAQPPQFDHGPNIGKTGTLARIAQGARQSVVIDMSRLPALVADQENAIVAAAGVDIGKISIGAFKTVGEIGPHEKVENAIDAVGRHPLAAPGGQVFGNVVGGQRPGTISQRAKHVRAHIGPLFPGVGQNRTRDIDQPVAGNFAVMMVALHGHNIGMPMAGGNQPMSGRAR